MKTSDVIVKCLENEGVDYIFGLPGEENLDLLESIRTSTIKLIITRHEQGAGFMAATYGRLTGKAGVCLSTLGPGATNLFTPAAYAQLGAMPMVMLTGQKPIEDNKQGNFQILDIVEMLQPVTKYSKQLSKSNNTTAYIREAFRKAQEERPGATHIEIPEDIAKQDTSLTKPFAVVETKNPSANADALAIAVTMISNSKNPLVLIGADANRKRTSEALTQFVDQLQIPFFNTQMGKGIIDERNSLYLGTAALSSDDFIHKAIDYADLILNVGHDTIEKPPFIMQDDEDRKVIHINFFSAEINEVYFPHHNVIGDIASTIKGLTHQLQKEAGKWNNDFYLDVKANVNEHLSKYFEDNRFPILPQRIVKITRDTVPKDGIVTLDNGIYKLWFSRNYPAYQQNTLILDNALATMGAGLASAMMAKELNPNKKVISVNGDGGFMMNSQELETAIRMELDLVIIILNDNAYGMIKWKQEGENLPDFGLDYKNPDFVKYAESFGAKGYRPTSVEDFEKTLQKTINEKGIHLIDLAVDYSLNHEILNVLIKKD